MLMRHLAAAHLLLGIITFATPVVAQDSAADAVHLQDGSRLAGDLQKWQEGSLSFTSQSVGELSFEGDQVVGLTTAEPVYIELEDGERVRGRLRYDEAEGTQHVVDTSFGDVTIDPQRITAVWHADQQSPERAQLEQQAQQQEQQAEQMREEHEQEVTAIRDDYEQRIQELDARQAELSNNWTARLEIGLNGATGNTERVGFNGRATAKRETDYDRLTLEVGGQYERDNGRETANNVFGGASLEVDLNDNLFTFLSARLERDEFEALELRTVVTGGLGYFIIQEEDHELKIRGGAGFQHETFRDGVTDSDVVAELGFDYFAEVNSWLLFTHSTTLYPTVEDPLGDYRVVSETAGEVPIGDTENWRIRAGMRNKYNAMPRPGIERLDTTYFLNLVYDWN